MFIAQLDNLKEMVRNKDLKSLENLLQPRGRVQNRKTNFKSALMLSAHKIEHLIKMDTTSSDCIMLNLEDGVSPEEKPTALRLAAYFLLKYTKVKRRLLYGLILLMKVV